MIVGYVFAGILAGLIAAIVSLFAGFGFLAAFGIYAATGFVVTLGVAAFTLVSHQIRQGPLPLEA